MQTQSDAMIFTSIIKVGLLAKSSVGRQTKMHNVQRTGRGPAARQRAGLYVGASYRRSCRRA